MIQAIFAAHRKSPPTAEVIEEIQDKLDKKRTIFEIPIIFSAYGIEISKPVKFVPFINLSDVIRQALSGSVRKTETFCTGILQHLDCSLAECQALILAPTCQLAKQIAEVMKHLGENIGLKVHACVGGEKHNLRKDRRALSQGGFHVIVGTPGRVCTILNKKLLQPDHIKMFVLNEADEMLSLGFRNQIKEIFQFLPSMVQLALFSATLHPEALKMTSKLMHNPVSLFTRSHEVVGWEKEGIKKFYVNVVKEEVKFWALWHICGNLNFSRCVIYANTLFIARTLAFKMSTRGHKAVQIDPKMVQCWIDIQLEKFRSGSSNVLITMPNFIVRAIDLQQVSLVINYDMSPPSDNYLRVWNGGRFGRHGVVIDLMTMNDEEFASEDDIHGFCDVVTVEGAGWRC